MNIRFIFLLAVIICLMPIVFAESDTAVPVDAVLAVDTDTEIDLSGIGTPQTVRVQYVGVEDEAILQVVVFGSDGGVNLYDTEISTVDSARILDLNGDGSKEIVLTGGVLAMNYISYCLTFNDNDGILAIPFANIERGSNRSGYTDYGYGTLTGITSDGMTLRGYQDILGTRFGTRKFKLENGKMELADDGLWLFDVEPDTWDYDALTIKRPIKVLFSDGKIGTLSSGTQIALTASDLDSIVYFITADGVEGSFNVEPDTEKGWGSLIHGTREDEWFEYLPYAG